MWDRSRVPPSWLGLIALCSCAEVSAYQLPLGPDVQGHLSQELSGREVSIAYAPPALPRLAWPKATAEVTALSGSSLTLRDANGLSELPITQLRTIEYVSDRSTTAGVGLAIGAGVGALVAAAFGVSAHHATCVPSPTQLCLEPYASGFIGGYAVAILTVPAGALLGALVGWLRGRSHSMAFADPGLKPRP
jgi:hypothetical protein